MDKYKIEFSVPRMPVLVGLGFFVGWMARAALAAFGVL